MGWKTRGWVVGGEYGRMIVIAKGIGYKNVIFVWKTTFVLQEICTVWRVSKRTTWKGTGTAKFAGEDIMAFSTNIFEFTVVFQKISTNV